MFFTFWLGFAADGGADADIDACAARLDDAERLGEIGMLLDEGAAARLDEGTARLVPLGEGAALALALGQQSAGQLRQFSFMSQIPLPQYVYIVKLNLTRQVSVLRQPNWNCTVKGSDVTLKQELIPIPLQPLPDAHRVPQPSGCVRISSVGPRIWNENGAIQNPGVPSGFSSVSIFA